jgi:tRNA 5-methylaminomethyl-2-thiouridine biosynthesis bifunctional protein
MTAAAIHDQSYVLPWAGIDWQTPMTPASTSHGDIYWSRDTALREKHHVFITGNHLEPRFRQLAGDHFTLCEVGFGFGLNFLLTANLWTRVRPPGSILNYIAIESAPVNPADLRRLYQSLSLDSAIEQSSWHAQTELLCARYPVPTAGHHALRIRDDIWLILVIGDARTALDTIDANVDAWYLDGFSPATNPDAWLPPMFRSMRHLSRPGATLATYSVAGAVRRGLQDAGFAVAKTTGFGTKAQMLLGSTPGTWRPTGIRRGSIAIIGAGLAGLHCARALQRRGLDATLFEARHMLAGASSIPQLAVHPLLATKPSLMARFSLAAFQFAGQEGDVEKTGRLDIGWNSDLVHRLQQIGAALPPSFGQLVDAATASDLLGTTIGQPALYLPTSGWCHPARQFQLLHDHLRSSQPVVGLEPHALLLANGDRPSFNTIIVAAGAGTLPLTAPLQFFVVRGQAVRVEFHRVAIKMILGGAVSVIPEGNGSRVCTVGSTYDRGVSDATISDVDSAQLLRQATALLGDGAMVQTAYAGIRCASRDREPVVGALPDWSLLADYAASKQREPLFAGYQRSLYVCSGFGSHGATTAPLCAEYLARQITGEASCLSIDWAKSLDAARFQLRDAGLRRTISGARPRQRPAH